MSSSDPSDMEHMGSSGLNSPLLSNHHNEHSAVRLNSFTSLSLSLSLSLSVSLSLCLSLSMYVCVSPTARQRTQ